MRVDGYEIDVMVMERIAYTGAEVQAFVALYSSLSCDVPCRAEGWAALLDGYRFYLHAMVAEAVCCPDNGGCRHFVHRPAQCLGIEV